MAYISYTATRKVITGHTTGYLYEMEIPFNRFDSSMKVQRKAHVSLGGQQETVLTRVDSEISITMGEFHRTRLPEIREFVHSVAGGESFTVDAYGTIATTDERISVQMTSNSVREQRVGTTEFFKISFKVREI